MNKGRLIVFTGIDGSGKTTQVRLLIDGMKQDGIDVSYVWSRWKPFLLRPIINSWKRNVSKGKADSKPQENFNRVENKKHKLLSNPVLRWLWLAAFFIDYGLQIFIKIRIGMINKKMIISDRMYYDSVIDQAINLGVRKDGLLENLGSGWMKILFPQPDMVIYVDCPADIAFNRKDDAPNVEYLENRRELYLKLAERYGWIIIDGTLTEEEIAVQIKALVYKGLNR